MARTRSAARRWLSGTAVLSLLAGLAITAPGAVAAPAARSAVHAVYYHSPVLNKQRRMQVYTPPGYRPDRRYPVLYLIHGACDDDLGWLRLGHARRILDEAIRGGRAKPMIVVMPNSRVSSQLRRGVHDDPFPSEMLRGVVPAVQKRYNVVRGGNGRAIAGLSMGGAQVLNTVLAAPGAFRTAASWSAGFAPAMLTQLPASLDVLDPNRVNAGLHYLELRLGTQDVLGWPSVQATRLVFDVLGVKHGYAQRPGDHNWPLWRGNLREFLPRLFPPGMPPARPAPPLDALTRTLLGTALHAVTGVIERLRLTALGGAAGAWVHNCVLQQDMPEGSRPGAPGGQPPTSTPAAPAPPTAPSLPSLPSLPEPPEPPAPPKLPEPPEFPGLPRIRQAS